MEKHAQTLWVRHDSLRLAVVAFWWNLTNQDSVVLVFVSAEDGAVLFVDGLGRTGRVSDKACHLLEGMSDKMGSAKFC